MTLLDVNGKPLDLTPEMNDIAQDVADRFGTAVVFTSGRRSRADQAEAMAKHVALYGRRWLSQTYLDSPVKQRLLRWIDANPRATSTGELRAAFLSILDLVDDGELRRLSLHTAGEAFDLRPQHGPAGDELKAHMKQRRDIKFLTSEAGVECWHAQRRGV